MGHQEAWILLGLSASGGAIVGTILAARAAYLGWTGRRARRRRPEAPAERDDAARRRAWYEETQPFGESA